MAARAQAIRSVRIDWRPRVSPKTARQYGQLLLYALAIWFAFSGSVIARGTVEISRHDGHSLHVATPSLWLGFILWLAAEIVGQLPQIRAYWRESDRLARARWIARIIPALVILVGLHRFAQSLVAPVEVSLGIAAAALLLVGVGVVFWLFMEAAFALARTRRLFARHTAADGQMRVTQQHWIVVRDAKYPPIRKAVGPVRALILAGAVLCSLVTWVNTGGNRIEPPIILVWLLSAVLWSLLFVPLRWNVFAWAADSIDRMRRWNPWRYPGAVIAFAFIMVLGLSFRLDQLDAAPPEMYADHVHNIQDAYRIRYQQSYPIFFSDNGGRDPIHFYLLAALASHPGIGFSFLAQKLLSAIESILSLPVILWFCIQVIGERRRKLGILVGLLAMGFASVSFWHAMIGRQALRVPLLALFVALTVGFYVRGLRHNRREDYVKAGLALGFGLLAYQGIRLLPAALVLGVALTLALRREPWRRWVSYGFNLGVLALVSFMVFCRSSTFGPSSRMPL